MEKHTDGWKDIRTDGQQYLICSFATKRFGIPLAPWINMLQTYIFQDITIERD